MSDIGRNGGGNARLPDRIIAHIFGSMQLSYGKAWTAKWASGVSSDGYRDDGVELAKAFWAAKLGGFADQPYRIKHALDHLPPHPPSLPEFRALCLSAQQPMPVVAGLIDAPKCDTKQAARNRARIAEMMRGLGACKRM